MWHRREIIPRLTEHCHFMPESLAELDIFCDGPHRADPAFQPRHKQDLHKGSASEKESSAEVTRAFRDNVAGDAASSRRGPRASQVLSRTAVILMNSVSSSTTDARMP